MFIFFGSFSLSVQNSISSIILIPVIILSALNFKTASLIPILVSIKTGITLPPEVYSNIPSKGIVAPVSLINQYNLSFFSSAIAPTQTALELIPDCPEISELPNIFCTVPTSDPSDVDTCIFIASLYSPLGTSLSSRSLFIFPPVN